MKVFIPSHWQPGKDEFVINKELVSHSVYSCKQTSILNLSIFMCSCEGETPCLFLRLGAGKALGGYGIATTGPVAC